MGMGLSLGLAVAGVSVPAGAQVLPSPDATPVSHAPDTSDQVII